MTAPSDRLVQLIPGLYRSRDIQLDGKPLHRLLAVLGTELDALNDAILALSDDHFVERASGEALLLLADLYGARLLGRDVQVNRGVVARSIAWRRRRGTQPTLEEVLRITTGWPAEVDESFRSLLHNQEIRSPAPWRGRTVVLWDPIATADPLSRNAPAVHLPPGGQARAEASVGREEDESLDEALVRLGRADAGRHAASPRTLDLLGWARPDVAVIRTSRLVSMELEDVDVGPWVEVSTPVPERTLAGFHLDPLGRVTPLTWLQPLERAESISYLTELHEPDPEPPAPPRTVATLLTPTVLAEDGDLAEQMGAVEIFLDGIQLVGPPKPAVPRGALPFRDIGDRAILRFADRYRPEPGDVFALKLIARRAVVNDPDTNAATGGPVVAAATRATRGGEELPLVDPSARAGLNGATVELRVRRLAGQGSVREPGGWQRRGTGARLGPSLGTAISVGQGANARVLRPELHEASDVPRLAVAPVDTLDWQAFPLAGDVPLPEASTLLVASDPPLWVQLDRDQSGAAVGMAAYTMAVQANDVVLTRLDGSATIRPPARSAASAVAHGGRLYLFGGSIGGAPLADLWSIALDGSETSWTPHPTRSAEPRAAAQLLSTTIGLVLIGGEREKGGLCPDVRRLDPSLARPRWEDLTPLPFEDGAPGVVLARPVPGGLEVVSWDDRTRPALLTWSAGDRTWATGPREDDAPNPPVPGDALWVEDRLVVVGPSPLPASEVVFSMGGESWMAFLPALDLVPAPLDAGDGETLDSDETTGTTSTNSYRSFHVGTDGSTWLAGSGLDPLHTRRGGALHASVVERAADRQRYGVPERLTRQFFLLRQRNLEPWDQPFVLAHEDVVGLDPRLGRVLLPANAPRGHARASYRVGRPSGIGAGALPVDRLPLPHWQETELEAPVPPDLRDVDRPTQAPVTAWVDPRRGGEFLASGSQELAICRTLDVALETEGDRDPVIGLLGSTQVPAATLTTGVEGGLSILAADFGSTPMIHADSAGRSLSIHPDLGGTRETDVWLAGLWCAGRVELAMRKGEVDLRWCTVVPGGPAIRVAGAGHQGPLTRRVLPPAELVVRLYGCRLGIVEVPPWVELIAAGCTFDSGSSGTPAIRALGARVQLRHCTVRGGVEAGILEASSSVFDGAVFTDRPDLGWMRFSLVPRDGRLPRLYRSLQRHVSFLSSHPPDPTYLVLADNNGEAALRAGENSRRPGAYADRRQRLRELHERTDDFLPIGLVPHQLDRTTLDLNRMARPTRRLQ